MFDAYLQFDGTCADALKFYADTFGGEVFTMRFRDAPDPMPGVSGDALDKVMHGSLRVGDRTLMACDWPAGSWGPYPGLSGVQISVEYPDIAQAQRVFEALSAGGSITMPMAPTFWVESFGMATDRFGVQWMVSGGRAHELPDA